MHGNVAEWTLDHYDKSGYPNAVPPTGLAVAWPTTEYSRVVRGGSYQDKAPALRCSARRGSEASWKIAEP